MKTNKNQTKIKGVHKQNFSGKLHSNPKVNYQESNEEENQEYQNDPEFEEEEQINFAKKQYLQTKYSREDFYDEENLNDQESNITNDLKNKRNSQNDVNYYNSKEYPNRKNNQYFNDFNIVKRSVDLEQKYNQKYGKTLKNRKEDNDNINLERNSENSYQIRKKEENPNNLKFNGKNNIENDDEEKEQKPEFTPKYYRNNPLVKKGNMQRQKLYMAKREENPLKSVAQKICNIVIKGEHRCAVRRVFALLRGTESGNHG